MILHCIKLYSSDNKFYHAKFHHNYLVVKSEQIVSEHSIIYNVYQRIDINKYVSNKHEVDYSKEILSLHLVGNRKK